MKIDLLINELKIELGTMSETVQIETLNKIRLALHKISPFPMSPLIACFGNPLSALSQMITIPIP